MRPELVGLLRCPLCREPLTSNERSLRCPFDHSFDIARYGYVNLLPGDARATTADSPRMVAARETFLARGHFSGLRCAISATAIRCLEEGRGGKPDTQAVIDVGAGTGYYLAGALDQLPETVGLALDLSKYSLRRAARAHERMGAVVCDVWKEWPLAAGSATLILDIFAPRNAPEFRRVLAPDGYLIVVTPTERHLRELVCTLGLLSVDTQKQQRIEETFAGLFLPAWSEGYETQVALDRVDMTALANMGPSAHHLAGDDLNIRLDTLPPSMTVTLSVTLSVYRPAL